MKRAIAPFAVLVFAAVAAAQPAIIDKSAAHIEYREKVMHIVGENMGAIGEIMKNQLPLEGNIAVHAQQLQLAASLVESAFRQRALDEKTESLPAIWDKWDEFAAAASKFEAASGKLVTAARTADRAAIGKAMREVGQTCGGCHNTFRKQD